MNIKYEVGAGEKVMKKKKHATSLTYKFDVIDGMQKSIMIN